jgi:hypothetical protein
MKTKHVDTVIAGGGPVLWSCAKQHDRGGVTPIAQRKNSNIQLLHVKNTNPVVQRCINESLMKRRTKNGVHSPKLGQVRSDHDDDDDEDAAVISPEHHNETAWRNRMLFPSICPTFRCECSILAMFLASSGPNKKEASNDYKIPSFSSWGCC